MSVGANKPQTHNVDVQTDMSVVQKKKTILSKLTQKIRLCAQLIILTNKKAEPMHVTARPKQH